MSVRDVAADAEEKGSQDVGLVLLTLLRAGSQEMLLTSC